MATRSPLWTRLRTVDACSSLRASYASTSILSPFSAIKLKAFVGAIVPWSSRAASPTVADRLLYKRRRLAALDRHSSSNGALAPLSGRSPTRHPLRARTRHESRLPLTAPLRATCRQQPVFVVLNKKKATPFRSLSRSSSSLPTADVATLIESALLVRSLDCPPIAIVGRPLPIAAVAAAAVALAADRIRAALRCFFDTALANVLPPPPLRAR